MPKISAIAAVSMAGEKIATPSPGGWALSSPWWYNENKDWLTERGGTLQAKDDDARGGHDSAKARFSRLVLPYLPEAYALARSLTGNRADAEDVIQDSCLRAFRALSGLTVTNPRAWMLTIVHRTAYTWLSKNRPGSLVAVDDLDAAQCSSSTDDTPSPEAVVIAKTEHARLQAAIEALPAPFRETVVLRDVEGLNYRDIAEITGVPIGTVMSRLTRARGRLIALLGR